MVNHKIIRYAIAYGRIREVARAEMWGRGTDISYLAELEEDYQNYATGRSGWRPSRKKESLVVYNIGKERERRKEQRGRKRKISEAQRKSAHDGLMLSEIDRFDIMTKTFR